MTRHLGDLGVAREDVVFGYFGTDLRVNPELSDLSMVALAEQLKNLGDQKPEDVPAEEVLQLRDLIVESIVHTDDVAEFLRLAKANGQGIDELLELMKKLIEATTGFPTPLPSDSSDGQTKTGSSSEVISSVPVSAI